jgi:hypothetical protein
MMQTRYGKTVTSTTPEVASSFSERLFFTLRYGDAMYKRAAYICEGGEVKQVHDEGYATVTSAFVARPKGCQYAVLIDTNGKVLLVDMFDLQSTGPHTTLEYKEDTHVFPSVEAAIMYAVTIY